MRKMDFRGWYFVEKLHAKSLPCRIVLVFMFMIMINAGNPLAAQTITNISVAQRTNGSGLTDVYYTLNGTAATYYISLEASFNNGVTFTPIASSFLSGNIGTVTPGTNKHIIWNGKGSSNNTYSTQAKVKLVANTDISCGQTLIINHIAGEVAPVTKTTTYGTVTGIPGEPTKCWITSNLGSDHQATSVDDATEASAGWYWQFNRQQGYKHDGITRIPNTPWITFINENSDWQTANDPCRLELGIYWRIPTYAEWDNLDNAGNWTNWNDPWNSGLKQHVAGYIEMLSGSIQYRGSYGLYWSGTQASSSFVWFLYFHNDFSLITYGFNKAYGFTLRCIRDN